MTRLKRRKELPSENQNDIRFGTPKDVAIYRAHRLAALRPDTIIEVGAGAGFQTDEFAKVAKYVIAVEIDNERLSRAVFAPNVHPIQGDALDPQIIAKVKSLAKGKTVVFLDPERAPSAKQRMLADIQPDINKFIKAYGAITTDLAIELPPFLTDVPHGFEREYLSVLGKLNRLTVYTGALRKCDISVVHLPGSQRIEHNGPAVDISSAAVKPQYILVVDAALEQAGIARDAIKVPVRSIKAGKKSYLLAQDAPKSPWLQSYKIIAVGKARINARLILMKMIFLHGAFSPEEHKRLQKDLSSKCRGKGTAFLFVLDDWYLCEAN